MNKKNEIKRLNRMKNQWSRYFTPYEYVLLDKLLFLSNNPNGFDLHVRFLAKDCNMSVGMASKLCAGWTFVKKKGTTKNMTISVDYKEAIDFIVHTVNNQIGDCSRHEQSGTFYCSWGEPKSNVPENVHVPNVNIGSEGTSPSEPDHKDVPLASSSAEGGFEDAGEAKIANSKRAERALPSAAKVCQAAPAETSNPIVHGVNNKKSARYEIDRSDPFPLKLPSGIRNIPSPVRQREIVRLVNQQGYSLVSDTPKGSCKDGFTILAYDDTEKAILITATDDGYVANKTTQAMCSHFRDKGYTVMVWLACDQALYRILSAKKGISE